MRTIWLVALVATGCCCLAVSPLLAGLYHPAEPAIWPMPGSFSELKENRDKFRRIMVDPPLPDSLRPEYLAKAEKLEAKEREGDFTVEDGINLSAYYIRLGRPEAAIRILEKVPRKDQNFMVLANLATAYQLTDNLSRADDYLSQALLSWPRKPPPGFGPGQFDWYRRAEQHHLALIRARRRQALQPRGTAPENVGAIFSNVRFIGPSGKFEAGLLAPEQWRKLPADALDLVKQLSLWLPHDDRVYWLLGEIYNASGDIASARDVLVEIVNTGSLPNIPELKEHRQILMNAKTPGEVPLPVASEESHIAWRQIGVAFFAGVLMTCFGALQLWVIRRNRHRRIAAMVSPAQEGQL